MMRAFAVLLCLKSLPMRLSWSPVVVHKMAGGSRRRLSPLGESTLRIPRTTTTIHWMTSSSSGSSAPETTQGSPSRRHLLDAQLEQLGIDSEQLFAAALQSIESPTLGYDGTYGKSAIKTYRAFLNPKPGSDQGFEDGGDNELRRSRLAAMAQRTAQQIEFLWKRHQSHETEWIRHHDAPTNNDGDDAASDSSPRPVFPIILILDNLRSAFNVGSIFRTADAAGVAEIYTTGICPHPGGSGSDKVRKSALGAEGTVLTRHFASTAAALEHLRRTHPDMEIFGLETTEQSVGYTDKVYGPHNGVALMFGNEVTGVDASLMPLLDGLVEIPMFGTKNSLNVASCAPIVLYEILRQWKPLIDAGELPAAPKVS